MPAQMKVELVTFLWAAAGGAAMALLYDIFRIKHRLVRHKVIFVHIDDVLFWTLAALLLSVFVFFANSGQIRGYIIIGAGVGAAAYIFTVGKILTPMAVGVLRAPFLLIKKIFKK